VSSTGARCPDCDDQADDCPRCGGRKLSALSGPASVRGLHWAEAVVRTLVRRWPARWPRSPRALAIAVAKIADLAPNAVDQQARLARICLEAAARRYLELTEYLSGRRLQLPRRRRRWSSLNDDDSPR
jgi:hypothetical protein